MVFGSKDQKVELYLPSNIRVYENTRVCMCLNFNVLRKKKSRLSKSLVRIYLSQTDDNGWEAKPQRTEEKMLQRMLLLQLILCLILRAGDAKRVT